MGVEGAAMTTPNAAELGCWDVEEERFESKWLNGFLLGELDGEKSCYATYRGDYWFGKLIRKLLQRVIP